jgi:hypothetical protein
MVADEGMVKQSEKNHRLQRVGGESQFTIEEKKR